MEPNTSSQAIQSTPEIQTAAVQTNQAPTQHPNHNQKKFLIILGILEIPFPILALHMLFPLLNLQNTIGTNFVGPYLGLVFFAAALILAVAQVFIGFLSYDLKLGKQKTKALIISGLIFAVLMIPAILLFVIMPIYSNMGTLK